MTPSFIEPEGPMNEGPSSPLDLDSARGVLDELFLLARHYRRSEKFWHLLRFVASFKRYSAFNAMLVHVQMPGARHVLRAKEWIQKYGRSPTTNAQPLVLLKPMGPVMFGFDVSQTDGKPLPDGFANPLEAHGAVSQQSFDRTVANARLDGVSVQTAAFGSTLAGYVRNAASPRHVVGVGLLREPGGWIEVDGRKLPRFAEITLNSNQSLETNYATLTHELGHLYCGHVGTPDPRCWPARLDLDASTREFEAESVSYLVCKRAGLDTPAVEYLHGYLNAYEEVPSISLDAVFKATQQIERMRSKHLSVRIRPERAGR